MPRTIPKLNTEKLAYSQRIIDQMYRFETPERLPFFVWETPEYFDAEKEKFVNAHAVQAALTSFGNWKETLDAIMDGLEHVHSNDIAPLVAPPMIPLPCPQETMITPFGLDYKREGNSVEINFHKPLIEEPEDDVDRIIEMRDGFLERALIPDLLDGLKYYLEETDYQIPVCLPDYQSPMGLASKFMDTSEFLIFLTEEDEDLIRFIDFMADCIIDLLKKMEEIAGNKELITSPYLQPKGVRGAIWDDYVSVINPELYKKHIAPINDKVLGYMGGGHIHTCGPCMGKIADAMMAHKQGTSFDVLFCTSNYDHQADQMLELKDQCRGKTVLNIMGMPFDEDRFTPDFVKRMNEDGGVMFTNVQGNNEQLKKWNDVIEQAMT